MINWKEFLSDFKRSEEFRWENESILVCQLAQLAAEQGTYGVGAVLLNAKNEILIEGHNEVHINGFRSDLHAEMVVINKLESTRKVPNNLYDYTLVSSLEPCPMCMTRLIFAGIGTILYVSPDHIGGMVQRKKSLPPIFQEITDKSQQKWGLAECSKELREVAFHIWDDSRIELDRRLANRKHKYI